MKRLSNNPVGVRSTIYRLQSMNAAMVDLLNIVLGTLVTFPVSLDVKSYHESRLPVIQT